MNNMSDLLVSCKKNGATVKITTGSGFAVSGTIENVSRDLVEVVSSAGISYHVRHVNIEVVTIEG